MIRNNYSIYSNINNSFPNCRKWSANLLLLVEISNIKQQMNADIYNALLKAMVMPDKDDINCYPVHTSAAAAIGELLEVFEPAFAALAATSRTWVDSLPEEEDPNETAHDWKTGTAAVVGALACLLQKVWLSPVQASNREIGVSLPPSSCLDAVSSILGTLMKLIIDKSQLFHLRIEELLVIWSQLIAEWDAWEEMEDMAVFAAIEEVTVIVKKYELKSFLVRMPPPPPSPPVPPCSIIEGIGAFLAKAISAYPSATWRACSCAHMLLHLPSLSLQAEDVKKALIFSFTHASFSHFKGIQHKPFALWKPLLLLIGACYISDPDYVETILEKDVENGCMIWASGMACISSRSFEPSLSSRSEIKLAGLTLMAFLERRMSSLEQDAGIVGKCFASLTEALIYLKEVEDNNGESDIGMDDVTEEDEETDTDEDSNDGDEETEEEFLERYEQATSGNVDVTTIDEGDVEDQTQEIELGDLDKIDLQQLVISFIQRHHHALLDAKFLNPELASRFISSFPDAAAFLNAAR